MGIPMRQYLLAVVLGSACCIHSIDAHAYIGPGTGIAFAGPILMTVAVTVLSLCALLLLPFRMLYRRLKRRRDDVPENPECKKSL